MLRAKEKERKKNAHIQFLQIAFLRYHHNLKVLRDHFLGEMHYLFIKVKMNIHIIYYNL